MAGDALAEIQKAVGDRYLIEGELGRGGMATVYRARDRRHGRAVAIKLLDATFGGGWGVDRFLREIEIAARLTHPHIVPLYDSGEAEGCVFYVMPLITGESLRERLRRTGPFPFPETARLTGEMASALDYAHRQGVVHRDIKPENILLSEGHAVIADFGIARAIGLASGSITQLGQMIGTPGYMSPEQVAGTGELDGRSDIYSLGCVLYEMLSGQPPFAGPTAIAIAFQHASATPPPLSALEPVPDQAERAILRALAKEPDQRFGTASELAGELAAAALPARPAAGFVLSAVPRQRGSNLPASLTPLLGREQDVLAVTTLLQRDAVRLLTLYGPGGIGKTRLALEAATRAADRFPGGACFVPLAEVRDPDQLESRIAQALGLREGAATQPGDALREQLRDQAVLLVLDNFEHLLDAAPVLTALLRDCPPVKALLTSQAILQVYGEHEYVVDPLAVPDAWHLTLDALEECASVRLFVERATAVRPDFGLTERNAAAVAEICRLLDGVPLAIELAGAQVRLEEPQTLLPKLRRSLAVLTGGARDRPARQLTMRSAIAWSYDLLAAEEQRFFRSLAVFAGGCTAAAAQAICQPPPPATAEELVDLLAGRSLVRQGRDELGELRFRLLQPIHAFARDALTELGEEDELRRRHARHFLALSQAEAGLTDSTDEVWLDRLERDHDNLRAALDWCVAQGSVEDALRLAVALWRFWNARSYLREGVERLSAVLVLPTPPESLPMRLKALYAAGILADACGNYPLGRRLFEEHLELSRRLGDRWAISNSLNNLGILLLRQGDLTTAETLFEESLALWRELGERPIIALSLANLGNVARLRRDFEAARQRYLASRHVFEEVNDPVGVAWSLSHLGDVARDEGDLMTAESCYRESLGLFTTLRHPRGMAATVLDLAELAVGRRDAPAARPLLEDALARYAEFGDQRAMLRALELFVAAALLIGAPERALRLAGAVVAHRAAIGAPLSEDESRQLHQHLADAVAAVGDDAASAAWREGAGMSIEQTLEYAVSWAEQAA